MKLSHPRKKVRPIAAFMFRLPLMIDCVAFENFIVDYFDGKLDRRQTFLFNMHLRVCRECREYLTRYKAAVDLAASQRDVPFSEMQMGEVPKRLIEAIVNAQK